MTDLTINPVSAALVVGALNLVGKGLKATPRINNEWIPVILMGCGAVVMCLVEGWTRDNAVLGVFAALSSVGAHQAALKGIQIVKPEAKTNEPNP